MKRIVWFMLLVFPFSLMAQKDYRGTVVDEQKEPLSFVNVVLLSRADSSFIAGVTTDQNGMFTIETDCKDCLLKVSAVGFETVYSDQQKGEIVLPTATYGLAEVAVSGKRPVYRMKGSSFITDVSNSLLQNIGTANDVLKQLPGVINEDDKFKVFGKGEATIFINERQVRDMSELERLNSEDIASVELINNPGSRYDADVKAVLKIKTKRKSAGFASQVRLRGTANHQFSDMEQVNMSFGTEQVNWYANLYHNGPRSQVDGRNVETVSTEQTSYRMESEMMDWDQRGQRATLESGLGFLLKPEQELGVSYVYDYSKSMYRGDNLLTLQSENELIEKQENYSDQDNRYNQHSVNLYYMGTLGKKLKVNLNVDYIRRDADNYHTVKESGLTENRTVTSVNNSLYNLYAAKLVLSRPVGGGTLEAGADFSYMDYDQTYLNVESYLSDGLFASEELKAAGFLNYSGQIGKLSYFAGCRYEQFRAKYFEEGSQHPTVDRSYKELYPNVSFSMPLNQVSLSLSYSKGTTRPTFYQLRNGIEYSNRFSYAQGNPYLLNSRLHDLSLNIGYRFLSLSLGYSYTKDYILLSDELRAGDPFLLVTSYKNEPKYQGISALLTFQHKIGWWNPTWTAGVFKNFLNLYDFKGNKIYMGHPYGYFSLNNMFSFPHGFVVNVDGSLLTAGNSGEYFMKPMPMLNLAVRKSFFRGKLDCNLQLDDLFASAKRRMTIYTEHETFYRWNYNDSRAVRLTLVFKFNSYKKNYKGENSAQDEMGRM